jgi:hypothetical protein
MEGIFWIYKDKKKTEWFWSEGCNMMIQLEELIEHFNSTFNQNILTGEPEFILTAEQIEFLIEGINLIVDQKLTTFEEIEIKSDIFHKLTHRNKSYKFYYKAVKEHSNIARLIRFSAYLDRALKGNHKLACSGINNY